MVKFLDSGHVYESVNGDSCKWTSVTSAISLLHKKFDESIVYKNVNDYRSKWYKMDPIEVLKIWKGENIRSTMTGSAFHKLMEDGEVAGIDNSKTENGWKIAGNQVLTDGVYTELLTYHPIFAICGQVDRVEVRNGVIKIDDWKTNKEIKYEGFNKQMMFSPLDHLPDCNFVHYALQLSMYMYLLLWHNTHLVPGQLTLKHVRFEIEGLDKHGYPITKKDRNGVYIVKDITSIPVPFLRTEVELILNLQPVVYL